MKGKWLKTIQAILIALVILAGSIAAPILCRPFFYWHIEPMQLPEKTGWTAGQIKTAYNEMMDFCIGRTDEFSVGGNLRCAACRDGVFKTKKQTARTYLRLLGRSWPWRLLCGSGRSGGARFQQSL